MPRPCTARANTRNQKPPERPARIVPVMKMPRPARYRPLRPYMSESLPAIGTTTAETSIAAVITQL